MQVKLIKLLTWCRVRSLAWLKFVWIFLVCIQNFWIALSRVF